MRAYLFAIAVTTCLVSAIRSEFLTIQILAPIVAGCFLVLLLREIRVGGDE